MFPLSVHLVGTVGTLPALRPLPCAVWRQTLTPRFLPIVRASASIPLDGPAPVHASSPRRLNSDGRVWKPERQRRTQAAKRLFLCPYRPRCASINGGPGGEASACRFLCPGLPTPLRPAPRLEAGCGFSPTKEPRTMATNAPACPRLHAPRRTLKLSLSLALYRALRPFTGPVLAWRVAFAWGAAS